MKYTREILSDVEGYVPGEQPKSPDVIKLNTNENPYPPSPKVIEAVQALPPSALRKYPDPLAVELRRACAARYGYDGEDWVIAGNGMDELLALAVRTFVDPGDAVLTTYPTYTLYETLVRLHGGRVVSVELDGAFQLAEAFYSTPARLCFLPRPNAPSGVCVPRAAVERLCAEFGGIVVIDEAYVDFAEVDGEAPPHCMDFPRRFENAIVMRTFSKSFSLAGARLGVAVARPEVIAEFLKTKDSYNLNAFTQAAGLAAFDDYAYMEANAATIRATRARLTNALRDMGFDVPASQSNFVLARWNGVPSARQIFRALKERAIFVRYFDAPRLDTALRISIGTDEEIDALLEALRAILG
ncbi:MAG: histidinol-phosphate transaminase [Candidatus Hydrogenedentes bacterium]|nr:histidinol-phosphate transaminase [Candidatus Hydrogenedentota bacterium]